MQNEESRHTICFHNAEMPERMKKCQRLLAVAETKPGEEDGYWIDKKQNWHVRGLRDRNYEYKELTHR